jgi:hypothetical protein
MTDTKCGRKICQGRSRDPEADRWFWVRFPNWADKRPPKAGWWCPACTGELVRQLHACGLEPRIGKTPETNWR